MTTATRIRTLGFDHARYGAPSLTADQLRAVIYMLMSHETIIGTFAELQTAYARGYAEWRRKTRDEGEDRPNGWPPLTPRNPTNEFRTTW